MRGDSLELIELKDADGLSYCALLRRTHEQRRLQHVRQWKIAFCFCLQVRIRYAPEQRRFRVGCLVIHVVVFVLHAVQLDDDVETGML